MCDICNARLEWRGWLKRGRTSFRCEPNQLDGCCCGTPRCARAVRIPNAWIAPSMSSCSRRYRLVDSLIKRCSRTSLTNARHNETTAYFLSHHLFLQNPYLRTETRLRLLERPRCSRERLGGVLLLEQLVLRLDELHRQVNEWRGQNNRRENIPNAPS